MQFLIHVRLYKCVQCIFDGATVIDTFKVMFIFFTILTRVPERAESLAQSA